MFAQQGLPFFEVYVKVDLAEAEKRDPKGLYKKARAGIIKNFTGVSDPYEPPTTPEITVHTGDESIEASSEKILAYLAERGLISPVAAAQG